MHVLPLFIVITKYDHRNILRDCVLYCATDLGIDLGIDQCTVLKVYAHCDFKIPITDHIVIKNHLQAVSLCFSF